MLINVKMPTTVGILTFMSMINFMLSVVEHEQSFLTSEPGLVNLRLHQLLYISGESLHRKARYEPNILQKFKLVACSKGRATVIAVVLGVFILVVVLIAVLAHGTSSCDKPLAVKATTTPNIVQDYISTNGKPFPYRDIRLPKAIIPFKYKLFMHPNISASFFVGTVNITCKVAEMTNFIVFHIKELNITELTVTEVESGVPVPVVEYFEYKTNEEVYVQLGTKLVVNKNVEISVGFRGDLVKKLAGFYKSTYKTDSGEERLVWTEITRLDRKFHSLS